MSDKQKKIMGVVGLILAAVAGAIMTSSLGSKPAVHETCEIVLKVLALAGFSTSASAFGKAPASLPETAEEKAKS